MVSDPREIVHHVVSHFTSIFTSNSDVQDNGLIEEVIPHLATDNANNLLIMMPSREEIGNVVFSMNKDGAPGPDGFGAFFPQTYWEIIRDNVTDDVLEFFTHNWIMPNMNANIVVLFPKVQNAENISQYKPIVMANFKSKILFKILVDILAHIPPNIFQMRKDESSKGDK